MRDRLPGKLGLRVRAPERRVSVVHAGQPVAVLRAVTVRAQRAVHRGTAGLGLVHARGSSWKIGEKEINNLKDQV